MNTNRRCVNAAVLVALFAFLLIGGSLAGALEPPAPPVPVPFSIAPAGEAPQTPDAGNVTAYDAWTGDSNWVAKGWFFPGETVTYVVGVNNTTGSNKNMTLRYTVYGPDGEFIDGGASWTYNLTTGPGIVGWGIQYIVPAGHGGYHMLVGRVIYNGNTTEVASPGHSVLGSTANNYLFDDSFEWTSNLSNWSAKQTDGGDLHYDLGAVIVGMQGLAVVIDDNKPLYLLDETPWSEWTYSAAFFFDPNSIVMKNGNVHNLFVERDGAGLLINIVQFRRYTNKYQLRFQTRKDGAGYFNSPWMTIADGPHRLTIGWSSSIWPGYNNGTAYFQIEPYPNYGGDQSWSKSNIDNDTRRIDSVLLGPSLGIDKQTRGTYFLDGFDSWR